MIKKLWILVLASLTSNVACASSIDLPGLLPWPHEDGNYLQQTQREEGKWYLAAAMVEHGKIKTMVGLIEQPVNPSAFSHLHIPGATMHVRGIECDSMRYMFVPSSSDLQGGYWMGTSKETKPIEKNCQIKNPPEKWHFIEQ
jgi:hypothetical protein